MKDSCSQYLPSHHPTTPMCSHIHRLCTQQSKPQSCFLEWGGSLACVRVFSNRCCFWLKVGEPGRVLMFNILVKGQLPSLQLCFYFTWSHFTISGATGSVCTCARVYVCVLMWQPLQILTVCVCVCTVTHSHSDAFPCHSFPLLAKSTLPVGFTAFFLTLLTDFFLLSSFH